MQKLTIIIPAHNEELRIKQTLQAYLTFFGDLESKGLIQTDILAVLNGCTDNTFGVVSDVQKQWHNCRIMNLQDGGKGFAIKQGFLEALTRPSDLIGFVDADMATSPQAFFALIERMPGVDGVIASRYRPDSIISPPRPWIKRWGSRIFYESLIRLLFGLKYSDYQCGAKVFKRSVIEAVASQLTVKQWAFDVELLFLCKKYGFRIIEAPTEWHDKAGVN